MEPERPSQAVELPLVEIIRDPETATVVLKPPRLAILTALREPGSASTVASSLGLQRQRLPYHIRELERVGLLKLVENRRRRGCVERVMQATARHYLLSPEILGELGSVRPADILRLGTFGWPTLMATASRTLLDLSVLRAALGDQVPALMLPAQVRFSEPTAFNDFVAELTAELARLCAKYHDETAATGRHRFFVAAYPEVPRCVGWPAFSAASSRRSSSVPRCRWRCAATSTSARSTWCSSSTGRCSPTPPGLSTTCSPPIPTTPPPNGTSAGSAIVSAVST